jgi:hypothetical protein
MVDDRWMDGWMVMPGQVKWAKGFKVDWLGLIEFLNPC